MDPTAVQDEDTPNFLLKVVIIGESGVGKSNIMSRFTNDVFSTDSKTTIGVAFATKNLIIEHSDKGSASSKKTVKLQVWDTAGQERYRALSSAYYRGALGALVVYDITNRQTLDSVPKWLEEIDRYCTQDIVVILVGNKCDLPQRAISVDEGKALAAKENMFFIETSAKDATNVEQAFTLLSREIVSASTPISEEESKKKAEIKPGVSLGTPAEKQPPPGACSC
eukprot:TRINITY_DN5591_c0_g1_i1.p1 TRINITY_DN5591_c0_g1~~TRINITY_DN5591_c0_g1_i1.p1  ORF type:complete len:251 (-),score=33.66 TRINITY_DN5591_c0_g1_i1:76-747(-)